MNKLVLLVIMGILLIPLASSAFAANPNLYVSAENPLHNNHFAGSMVVEVVISDPSLSDTSEGKGEPDVTVNGKDLRMVQATDGKWYGYFANVDKARAADQTVPTGQPGKGLDFGVFCSKDTISLGPSFTQSEGIAVPRAMTGSTNGQTGFNTCTGTPSGPNINNVVKFPKSINTNPSIQPGQINLNADAWPIIQLYSFNNDVVVQYNAAGGTQQVKLQYDDIPNIALSLDRTSYPPNSEVFVTIHDMQLNQDPTARDSWTFNVESPQAVFYHAFTENGSPAASGAGLVNLMSHLSNIGFEKNGKLSMVPGSVVKLKSNGFQAASVSDSTTTYQKIVTFVETQPNSAVFETGDFGDVSSIGILSSAPRGQSATIQYNSKSTSIVSGLATADISLGSNRVLSGQKIPVTVVDPDQNINNGVRDRLEVFRSSALIPSLTIGNPITLESASGVKFHANSGDNILTTGTSVSSSVPDKNSDRLIIDTRPSSFGFAKISMNLGISASQLQSVLINTGQGDMGTNWVNYDMRSFANQLGISSFSGTSISLFFSSDSSTVTLLGAGSVSSQGFAQISDATVTQISSKSGPVFLVVDFGTAGNVASETDTQPLVFDLFSFGKKGNTDVNNAIYRFELRETAQNSSTFTGTLEYVIASQLNQFDANLIRTLRTIDQDVKFFVNQRLIDEKGINIAYADRDATGLTTETSTKTDVRTNSGTVSLNSKTFRFGSPVTVTLMDHDLNVNHDTVDIYSVIDNPASSDVDAVGGSGGILLEVLIKDIRYKRCTINGVEYGGLASTGFTLVETGPNTGRFEGTFKMPSKICNRSGTELISTAGGIVDLKYYDFRDSSGQQNIIRLSKDTKTQTTPTKTTPALPSKSKVYVLPSYGKTTDVVLTGKIPNYKQGTTIQLLLTMPDGKTTKLDAFATKQGLYKTLITLKHNSPTGKYIVDIKYMQSQIGKISFDVVRSSSGILR
ncbi:MAG: peptidase [Candidatus Nitrosotenuis sp.]